MAADEHKERTRNIARRNELRGKTMSVGLEASRQRKLFDGLVAVQKEPVRRVDRCYGCAPRKSDAEGREVRHGFRRVQ